MGEKRKRLWRTVATWRVEQLESDGTWKSVARDYQTEDQARWDAEHFIGPEFEEEG